MRRNLPVQWILFYVVSVVFLLLNIWFIVKKDTMMVSLLPLALAIVLLAVYSLDKVLLAVVFLTPLSLPLHALLPQLSFDMFLPTEPLLFGVLLIFTGEAGFWVPH